MKAIFFLTCLALSSAVDAMKPHKNPNDPPNPSPVLQTFKHEEDSEKREDIWILSIDGGGIRGVIPAFILCQIQDLLDSTLSQNLKQRIEAGP